MAFVDVTFSSSNATITGVDAATLTLSGGPIYHGTSASTPDVTYYLSPASGGIWYSPTNNGLAPNGFNPGDWVLEVDDNNGNNAWGDEVLIEQGYTLDSGTLYATGNPFAVDIDNTPNTVVTASESITLNASLIAAEVGGPPGGVLDLADNDMIDSNSGDYTSIAGWLKSGYDSGKWDGEVTNAATPAAIVSSVAAEDITQTESLGYALIGSNTADGQLNIESVDGNPVSPGDVVVKYTEYGDANLDGTVDLLDLAQLKNGIFNNLSGWSNGCFDYGLSVDAYDTGLLANTGINAPTDLSAVDMNAGEIDLSWTDNNQGEVPDSLTVTTGGQQYATYSLPAGTNKYALTGLAPDQTYQIALTAEDSFSDGTTLVSDAITANFAAPAVDFSMDGPASVSEGDTGDVLSLFSGSSSNVILWQLHWTDASGSTVASDSVTGAGGTDAFPPLTSGLFNVNISATDSAGFTFSLPEIGFQVTSNAPSGLQTSAVSSTEIDLQWTNNSNLNTGFDVYRSADNGTTWTNVADVAAGVTSFDDAEIVASSTYDYDVLADATAGSGINSVGATVPGTSSGSGPSGPAMAVPQTGTSGAVTTPNGVPTISVSIDAVSDSAVITWSYVGNNCQGFELEAEDTSIGENYYTIKTPGPVIPVTPGGTGTGEYTFPIVPGDKYNFRLRVDRTDGTVSG